jgi:hypothetical protein
VGSGPLAVADPIDRIDQPGVGREIEMGADPSEGRDDPVEDLGFHAAPGATLEVSGDLLGAVWRDLAIEEGLQGSTHLAAIQPNGFDVASGPGHRSPPEVSRRALCRLRNGLALLGEPVQAASASTSTGSGDGWQSPSDGDPFDREFGVAPAFCAPSESQFPG